MILLSCVHTGQGSEFLGLVCVCVYAETRKKVKILMTVWDFKDPLE